MHRPTLRTWLPLLAGCIAIALLLAEWQHVITPLHARGSDFSATYVAAHVWTRFGPSRLYDEALEHAVHATFVPSTAHFTLPFLTPPLTAFITIPLSRMPLPAAYLVFSCCQLLLTIAGTALGARALGASCRTALALGLLLGASIPSLLLVLLGQWDGLIACLMGTALFLWSRKMPFLAGALCAIGLAFAKPQLGLGIAVLLIASRQWRATLGAAAGGLLLAGATVAIAGLHASLGFFSTWSLAVHSPSPQTTVGILGFVASWIHAGGALVAATLVLDLACCAFLVGTGIAYSRGRLSLAEAFLIGTAGSLLLAPHVLVYDLVICLPALAGLVVLQLQREEGRSGAITTAWLPWIAAWVGLNMIALIDAGNSAPAPPGRLLPLALTLGCFGVWCMAERAQEKNPAR